jgi:hypothetical protein
MNIDIEDLAEQITIWQQILFISIKPREYLDINWTKDIAKKKSPNLVNFQNWSNHITDMLITEVMLLRNSTFKFRSKAIENIILLGLVISFFK